MEATGNVSESGFSELVALIAWELWVKGRMGTEEVGTVNVHLVEHLGNMRSMKIYFTVVSF